MVRLRIILSKVALQKRGSMEPMEPPLDPPLMCIPSIIYASPPDVSIDCWVRLATNQVYNLRFHSLV